MQHGKRDAESTFDTNTGFLYWWGLLYFLDVLGQRTSQLQTRTLHDSQKENVQLEGP